MTPEDAIAAGLERQLGSLSLYQRHRIYLEQEVYDGIRWRAGPHPVGWVERIAPGKLRIKLIPTRATTTARALLEEDLLDVVLSDSYPAVIRLTVLPTSAAALT